MSLCVMKVSPNKQDDHGTSFLCYLRFAPLGVSGVEESRGAAIAARADRAGLGVEEVSRASAWTQPAVRTGNREWNSGWKVILCEFYQVCTQGKVVRRSRNITAFIPSPQIQMSWSFDLRGRVQSVTVMWLLLLLAVSGKAPCFTFLQDNGSHPELCICQFIIPHDGDVTLTLLMIAQLGFPMCRNSAPSVLGAATPFTHHAESGVTSQTSRRHIRT